MRIVSLCIQVTIALFLIVAGGGCTNLHYFPPTAQGMAEEQLAKIIPDNTAYRVEGYVPFAGNFVFKCPVDSLVENISNPDSIGVRAEIVSIRSLDPGANGNEATDADNPLYVVPGKYEFGIFWMYFNIVDNTATSSIYRGRVRAKIQLDAKAGKTYVLSGKATDHGLSVTASFTFTEKP
jgi:hypothetical protein